jgi:hypothetical protein
MLSAQEKSSAGTTMTAAVARMVAALWIAVVPCAGAVAAGSDYQVSAARAAAIHACSVLASQYSVHDWGNTEFQQYRTCMAKHGQRE